MVYIIGLSAREDDLQAVKLVWSGFGIVFLVELIQLGVLRAFLIELYLETFVISARW